MDDRKCQSIDRRSTLWYGGANIGKSPSYSHNMDSEQQWTTAQRQGQQRNVPVLSNNDQDLQLHQEKLVLHSRTNPNVTYEFPLYEDSKIGIHENYQGLLCEAYDKDDDIDTKSSVMNYFIQVCADDIRDAIELNREEDQPKETFYQRAQRLYTSSEPCRKIVQEQQQLWSQRKQQ